MADSPEKNRRHLGLLLISSGAAVFLCLIGFYFLPALGEYLLVIFGLSVSIFLITLIFSALAGIPDNFETDPGPPSYIEVDVMTIMGNLKDGGPPKYSRVRDPSSVSAQLYKFMQRDPGFNTSSFEAMARDAALMVKNIWNRMDLSTVESLLTPQMYETFDIEMNNLERAGLRRHIENLAIGNAGIVEASNDGVYDFITVKLSIEDIDYTVDEKKRTLVSGDKKASSVDEYWTFLRSDKLKSAQVETGSMPAQCPDCGAGVAMNAIGRCMYCGGELLKDAFNWALSRISGERDWRPRAYVPQPPVSMAGDGDKTLLDIVSCPNCGANVRNIKGIPLQRCWRCGDTVITE